MDFKANKCYLRKDKRGLIQYLKIGSDGVSCVAITYFHNKYFEMDVCYDASIYKSFSYKEIPVSKFNAEKENYFAKVNEICN